ncbi:MAG: DUF3520 domain-containing protein [Ignavibacteriales bacterium]|nr:DUF3520 domain-containing protein [Ignavibacteriales bacterium]
MKRFFAILAIGAIMGACGGEMNQVARKEGAPPPSAARERMKLAEAEDDAFVYMDDAEAVPEFNTEEYDRIYENEFIAAIDRPLSTFSIDVDAASYANTRRFINNSQLPPKDAVRVEEFINYFSYDYPAPTGEDPFSINVETAACPWNAKHKLVHIGIQGVKFEMGDLPPNNLVFLLDVSGSMDSPNKLGLLKKAIRLLVDELRPEDRVSIAVYAGAAGVVLPPTSGDDKAEILAAIERLTAGGSTAGGEGIKLAYELANENFMKDGNNRVIIATDGDFNVGPSSDAELTRMIEARRDDGIFLTVLGFGMGNYKDSKMEKLADKGNGNYAYIDNILEAKKTLVNEVGSTLLTIAKDVKIQVEFNPAKVEAYRLIGYENRLLNDEDFNDDTKDAGELGAGHTVTAIYEIVPAGTGEYASKVDDLKYRKDSNLSEEALASDELMTVKIRYKKPDGDKSKLIVRPVLDSDRAWSASSENFKFAAAVASFAMLLRESEHKGDWTYDDVIKTTQANLGEDEEGYRAEFLTLVKRAKLLAK